MTSAEFAQYCADVQAEVATRHARIIANAPADGPAMKAAMAALVAQGTQTRVYMLKRRAREYQLRPAMLEILYPGLACVEPRRMIAIGEALRRNEAQIQRHSQRIDLHQTRGINANAVVLLGRYRRRFERALGVREFQTINPQLQGV